MQRIVSLCFLLGWFEFDLRFRDYLVLWVQIHSSRLLLRIGVGAVSRSGPASHGSRFSRSRGKDLRARFDQKKSKAHQRVDCGSPQLPLRLWVRQFNVYFLGCNCSKIDRSSNAMPRQVREAIAWCISVNGSGDMPLDRALDYVEEMFEDGRGAEESW